MTKASHPSIRKISLTMRRKRLDNFAAWREKARKKGVIKSEYAVLKKNGDLAELIGVILGDGNITRFARTEGLRVVGNWENQGFIKRYAKLTERVFGKKPHVGKRSYSNAANITLYECHISRRLGIPTGAKGTLKDVLPKWISRDRALVIRYLRGLYEAEGSYSVHEATYTHKFLFANTNPSLLQTVFTLVQSLGFHPHASPRQIQLSRKQEVQKLKNLLQFRCY